METGQVTGYLAIAPPTGSTHKGTTMNKFNLNAIAIAIGLAFCAGAMADSMPKEYQSGKDSIAAEYKSAKAACGSLSGNANDICKAAAGGTEKVAKAELEARYRPSEDASYNVRVARADADYAVASERCDDKAGNVKDVCVKRAQAAAVAAKADAKAASSVVTSARSPGSAACRTSSGLPA